MTATCYKNYPVVISYTAGGSDTIYANTVSLSENLALERAESLGVKGSNAVFNTQLTKGSIGVESYVVEDLTNFNSLKGSNDQGLGVSFGPYTAPSPCIMTSMSISITVGEPISIDRSFDYFGSLSSSSSPASTAPDLNPAIPSNITFAGYADIGGSANITDISWNFSQSYQEIYLVGQMTPVIVFNDGQIELSVNGEKLTTALLGGGSCVLPPKNYSIEIGGCNGGTLGTLDITKGYMQSRGSSVSSDGPERNDVSIIEYL